MGGSWVFSGGSPGGCSMTVGRRAASRAAPAVELGMGDEVGLFSGAGGGLL